MTSSVLQSVTLTNTNVKYCYAGCQCAERHYAERHSAGCQYAKCHYAECHSAECHSAECRGAKSGDIQRKEEV
jgi:hypothetical protein